MIIELMSNLWANVSAGVLNWCDKICASNSLHTATRKSIQLIALFSMITILMEISNVNVTKMAMVEGLFKNS